MPTTTSAPTTSSGRGDRRSVSGTRVAHRPDTAMDHARRSARRSLIGKDGTDLAADRRPPGVEIRRTGVRDETSISSS